MGFAWNGRCYSDTDSALSAFVKDMTTGDSSGINAFAWPPTITAGGLVSWSILNRSMSATDPSLRSGSTQLLSCTASSEQWPVQSLLVVLAFAFAALLGFRTGFKK